MRSGQCLSDLCAGCGLMSDEDFEELLGVTIAIVVIGYIFWGLR